MIEMLEALRRRNDCKEDSTAVWAAFWLAVVLVAAKAYYLAHEAADPPSDALSFVAALAAISYTDVIFAAGVGFFHRLALAALRPPAARSGAHAAFCFLYMLSAVYGVLNLEVFGFFLTPLTFPLLSLSGDLQSFATSIAPFLTYWLLAAVLTSLLLFARFVSLSQSLARTLDPARARRLRAAVLVTAISWVVFGRHEFDEGWNGRIDRRIAENAHWTFLASTARAWVGAVPVALAEPVIDRDLDDFLTVAERNAVPIKAGMLKPASLG
ncbi:MAG TPA: hypothetical protein VMR29_09775, partial [Candidatus Binatia bacterium]|nr:hypothetical protein [Candidatus Binatia bacterium]